jgi:hypothetical protein
MTTEQAKEVLRIYRRGVDDPLDPELVSALELVKRDPELRSWYDEQSAIHDSLRTRLRALPVPDDLHRRIVAGNRRSMWRSPLLLSAAAALVLFIGIALLWEAQQPRYAFSTFRQKMVRTAMGGYPMPLMTNDLKAIRSYIRSQNGHADYALTPTLQKMPGEGGVVFPWHSRTVSLVCLDGGKGRDIFLFVIDRKAVTSPPSSREFATIGRLPTASWVDGDKVYILATKGDDTFLRSLL